ncbi:hypothetical protein [Tropicimonas sp. S265A]|uniref:hypothetical protein n=1 Tax=Tropicimonas sp. S265A TaxID=3415134 RepID=UPI003C7B8805
MRRSEIAETVNITAPVDQAGAYTTKSSIHNELYVWYKDGDSKPPVPHFTVGSRDEKPHSPYNWNRLHVTVPFVNDKSVANIHFFYQFDASLLVEYRYCNEDDLNGAALAYAKQLGTEATARQLAQAFVTAAHAEP